MERQNIFTGIKMVSYNSSELNDANKKQKTQQNNEFLSIKENNIIIRNKQNYKIFKFDCCLGKYSTQQQIYDNFCLSMVEDFVEGYDCTLIICSNNKSNNGYNDVLLGKDAQQMKGLLPRFIDQITNSIQYLSQKNFLFKVSYLEINEEDLIDLLGIKKCKLQIKPQKLNKNQFYVSNLEIKALQKIDQIQSFYLVGSRKREYSYSKQYRKRQNSTVFFTIYLQSVEPNGTIYKSSKFSFVQLSESSFQEFKLISKGQNYQKNHLPEVTKNQTQNINIFQKKNINLSNYAFQNVINTIVYGDQSAYVPFCDSKVTKLLRQSLGGHRKTSILGLVNGLSEDSLQKTFKLLKSLQIASQIQNSPINLKQKVSQQFPIGSQSLVKILQQINKIQNELDKVRVELQILISNSKFVERQIKRLKDQNGQQIIKDNEFCSQQNIQDHILQQKTKKQWQLKQQIKNLQKKLKQKISFIQNLQNNHNFKEKIISNQTTFLNQETIITKRKQILQRIKNIKQKRLISIPITDIQHTERQKKRQIFALEIQFQKQKNIYTSTIRALQQKTSFYKKIAQHLLKKQEIQIIKANSKYDQTKRQFQLPMFMVKDKKMKPVNIMSPLGSQRKFFISPKSTSFHSYHSISVQKNQNIKHQFTYRNNNIQKILARKPKISDDYLSQYQINKNDADKQSVNLSNRLKKLQRSKQMFNKRNLSKSPTKFSISRNIQKTINGNNKNGYGNLVKSEYQIQDIDVNRVKKFNQERKALKQKQRVQKTNFNSTPNTLMKRQHLYTEPQIEKVVETPIKLSAKNILSKSPLHNFKKWM